MLTCCCRSICSLFLLLLVLPLHLQAETNAKRFPPGAVALLESHQASALIQRIEESDLPATIVATPKFQEYQKSEDYNKAKAGRSIAETLLAMDLLTLAKKLTAGDISLAIYPTDNPKKPDSLLLINVPDSEILKHLRKQLDPFLVLTEAQTETLQAGRIGIETFQFDDKLYFALGEDWLFTANTQELLDKALALHNAEGGTLADDKNLSLMKQQTGKEHLLSLYINTEMIAHGAGGRFIPAKLDNPLGSLLLGGLFEMAAQSPYAAATLNVEENQFVLATSVSGKTSELSNAHQSLFSNPMEAGTEAFPTLENRQSGFTLHRDFAGWYQQREELLEDKVLPSFDQFETNISNLLPGRDFGTDVLPLLGKNMTFLTAPQDFSHLAGSPGVKLPGIALIVELADEQEGAQVIQLFFQTLAAILNIEAGKQGRQPWLVQSEMYHDVSIQFGKYLEKPKGDRLPIVFNFMPASAQVGDRYVLSTSVDLCKKLIDYYTTNGDTVRKQVRENKDLQLELVVAPIATALEQNQDVINAKAVQDGKELEQAKQDLELFLTFLKRLNTLDLQMGSREGSYELKFSGSWNE